MTTEKTKELFRNEYLFLGRLKSDCDYCLGYGFGSANRLWAGNVKGQILKMRELYQIVQVKPDWLTEKDIDNYEAEMLNYQKRH